MYFISKNTFFAAAAAAAAAPTRKWRLGSSYWKCLSVSMLPLCRECFCLQVQHCKINCFKYITWKVNGAYKREIADRQKNLCCTTCVFIFSMIPQSISWRHTFTNVSNAYLTAVGLSLQRAVDNLLVFMYVTNNIYSGEGAGVKKGR